MAKQKLKVPKEVEAAFEEAVESRARAYAPYSKFLVGAAVLSGKKSFKGCNVENASYGGTMCAERVAIFHAVEQGVRKFDHVIVVTEGAKPAPPCGLCRQVMAEFCSPKTQVWLGNTKEILEVHSFESLLPFAFGPSYL